jgi:hypothetical protein
MHRTQILLEHRLYREAMRLARARHASLGEIMREALEAKLAARGRRSGLRALDARSVR